MRRQPGAATVSHNRHKWEYYVVGVAVGCDIGLPWIVSPATPDMPTPLVQPGNPAVA
jgi:hypothetical protein